MLWSIMLLTMTEAFADGYILGVYPSAKIGLFCLQPSLQQEILLEAYLIGSISFKANFGIIEFVDVGNLEPYLTTYGNADIRLSMNIGNNFTIGPGIHISKIWQRFDSGGFGLTVEAAKFTTTSSFPWVYGIGLQLFIYSDVGVPDLYGYLKIPLRSNWRITAELGLIRTMVGIERPIAFINRREAEMRLDD